MGAAVGCMLLVAVVFFIRRQTDKLDDRMPAVTYAGWTYLYAGDVGAGCAVAKQYRTFAALPGLPGYGGCRTAVHELSPDSIIWLRAAG